METKPLFTMKRFSQEAFVDLCFFNISSSLVEDILQGQAPDTPTLLENYQCLNSHSAPEWNVAIQPGEPKFYSNQGFKEPRAMEEQNNLTEAEDVSKDSRSRGCFWSQKVPTGEMIA